MNISLIDLDSKMPNLALMKISSLGKKDKTYVDGHKRIIRGKTIWVTGHYRKL